MRNKVIILLIPLFFASGFGLYAQNIEINPPRPAKSDDYLKQSLKTVKKLIRVGNYDRALNLLMSMKKSFGNRKEIIDELKNVYRNKKDYSSLKNLILNELKTNPDSFMAICQLAEVYFLTDSLDTAKKYWEKAFELAGPSESRYIILAGYYRSYGFYDEAVSVYRRARAIFKKPQLFSRELSDIFLSRRDYKGAVAEYLRLLENGTEKKTKISKRIVSIASEADKPGEIEQVINSAIKNNPDNPILYSILGDINILDNNLTAAFENYKRADKLSPLKGDFIYGFTGLCYDNGKYEMAIQAADYYLAHIQNEKGRSRVNLLKAKSLVGLGFYLQAVELLDNIEKTSSDAFCKVDAILTAGEIYAVNLKDFEAAKDKFARIAFGKRYNFFSMIAKIWRKKLFSSRLKLLSSHMISKRQLRVMKGWPNCIHRDIM
ncbi:MAG: hypothetical protein B6D58_05075 [candidate division Zixibacteria bacterium 4484_95]|nr:MAG: hypothetical protein B6D58_05075 [candidate division Zixibacteria bacterium 4484_95]